MPTKQRAEPLAPEERRRSIVEAVIPLILEKGSRVTTAEMAEAAGIAEGTIFRAFPDKTTLLFEACKSSFDPEPELDQLAAIEPDLPFETKLRTAAGIILERQQRVHALAAVLRSMPPPTHSTLHDAHRHAIEANTRLFRGIAEIFDDAADLLSVKPSRAAAAFRGLLYASSLPFCAPEELISADEAIEFLLEGVMRRNTT